jgi:hypothetical protein
MKEAFRVSKTRIIQAKTLNPSGNQQKDMKRLDSAMKKLLKDFPPPTKK